MPETLLVLAGGRPTMLHNGRLEPFLGAEQTPTTFADPDQAEIAIRNTIKHWSPKDQARHDQWFRITPAKHAGKRGRP